MVDLICLLSSQRIAKVITSQPTVSLALASTGLKLAIASATSTSLFQLQWDGPSPHVDSFHEPKLRT